MSYRDKTWCTFYMVCRDGLDCDKALTDDVRREAIEWWGGNPPVCVYAETPECFVSFFDDEDLKGDE